MILVLNVFSDYVGFHLISYAPNEIAITPQLSSPKLFSQFRISLKYLSCRYAFHDLHYSRRSIPRRGFDKYMHMIFHHFHDVYVKFVLFGYSLENPFYVFSHLIVKNMLPVFGYPYHVVFNIIDSVFSTSHSHAVCYNSYSATLSRVLIALRLGRFHPRSKLWGISRPIL